MSTGAAEKTTGQLLDFRASADAKASAAAVKAFCEGLSECWVGTDRTGQRIVSRVQTELAYQRKAARKMANGKEIPLHVIVTDSFGLPRAE